VITVMMVCRRMMVANPSTPPPTISAVMTRNAMIFVPSPPPQPRRWKTVAVASVARAVSTISHPTHKIQETTDGSLLPLTPKAARLRTSVGAEPRLPASATKPHSRKDTTIPISPAIDACQKEIPKPSTNAP